MIGRKILADRKEKGKPFYIEVTDHPSGIHFRLCHTLDDTDIKIFDLYEDEVEDLFKWLLLRQLKKDT